MSKIALSGNASGTGTLTIASQNTSSNYTITLPNETGTLTTTASTPTFTGAVTAPSFIPNGSSAPTNGVYLPAANSVGIATNSSERVRVDSSGNVGIGTSSPNSLLTVQNGNILLRSAVTTGALSSYNLGFSATATGGAAAYITSYRENANEASALVFGTWNGSASAERARIDSSGNVGIGTNSPGAKLDVVGQTKITSVSTVNGSALDTYGVTGDKTVAQWYLSKYDNDNTTAQILVRFAMNNGATGQGQINGNGANACAFGSYSDRRLKENIVDLPPQLDNIMALRPVEFDYIQSEGGGHQISFIAQDIEQIYPDAVGEREDGMKTLTGWDKTTARLVKAIQELKAELDATKAEVAALKAKE